MKRKHLVKKSKKSLRELLRKQEHLDVMMSNIFYVCCPVSGSQKWVPELICQRNSSHDLSLYEECYGCSAWRRDENRRIGVVCTRCKEKKQRKSLRSIIKKKKGGEVLKRHSLLKSNKKTRRKKIV